MNLDEIREKYGLQGELFASSVREDIEYYKKKGWELRILRDDRYALVIGIVNFLGVKFHVFSKFHGCYLGSFSVNSLELEKLFEKSSEFWECEPECAESL